ncbi:hypothetical protein PVAP13_7KG073800 [Panicum virgatum]|uniref:Uncharacterized protein n=1 Tax=Panicum virgatum TaxID=38727 RepID=A0A8T0QAW4_PANVG|nr:hypothetical protein PVAP13_7KG073800 [Panicum virgatum]
MSSSPETSVFHLRINQGLLDYTNCHRTLRPETYHCRAYTCRQCIRGQIYCRDCIHRHHCLATDTHSTCDLLNNIIAQIKFKCDCNKYIPYCEFLEHQRECPFAKYSTHTARWRKCILKTSFLQCSECKVPLRPPIFSLWFCNRLICSACYHADLGTYRHCTELEYLLQGITVKCVACKQYLPFSTLGSHQVGDCLKHKLQNIAPDEQETEMGSNSIHGKHKRKAPFEVGKMDKHIVHGDEVGYDDGSCDDNHGTSEDVFSCEDDSVDKMDEGEEIEKPATVKRVAKNAFKTTCDRKAKIAMPYGQKTAQASASPSQRRRITTPRKPPPPRFVPHRQSPAAGASNRPNVKLPTSSGSSSASRTQDAYIVVS